MMKRRMIGKLIYDKYSFRRLGATCRDLYTYLMLNCDNDGVCDNVYDIMTLNKSVDNDLRSLIESEFVLPLLHDNALDICVWLPDFLWINRIEKTKGYSPSQYRDVLRARYPWAPIMIVRDSKDIIRTDITNDNLNIGCDPRTGLYYHEPKGQEYKERDIKALGPPNVPQGYIGMSPP